MLYKRGERELKLVVPSLLRREIILNCHDTPDNGNFGVLKTKAKIRKNYWWPGLSLSVQAYVASCSFYQKKKTLTLSPVGKLQPITIPKKEFALVGIDHICTFKRFKLGNRYILAAIDYLCKWIIAKPVTSYSRNIRSGIHENGSDRETQLP